MSVDAYEDHIRFLGYHVPLDTSKLPPTAVDALVQSLNGEDGEDALTEDDLYEAESEERSRVIGLIEDHLSASGATPETEELIEAAATGCAQLVIDNLKSIKAETSFKALRETLARWFENEIKSYMEAAAEDAADARLKGVRTFLDELDAA